VEGLPVRVYEGRSERPADQYALLGGSKSQREKRSKLVITVDAAVVVKVIVEAGVTRTAAIDVRDGNGGVAGVDQAASVGNLHGGVTDAGPERILGHDLRKGEPRPPHDGAAAFVGEGIVFLSGVARLDGDPQASLPVHQQ